MPEIDTAAHTFGDARLSEVTIHLMSAWLTQSTAYTNPDSATRMHNSDGRLFVLRRLTRSLKSSQDTLMAISDRLIATGEGKMHHNLRTMRKEAKT